MILVSAAMEMFLELKFNDITTDSNDEYCNYKILLKIMRSCSHSNYETFLRSKK